MDVEWRPIKNWPDYEVSNTGEVRSFKHRKPRIMEWTTNNGYPCLKLSKDGGIVRHYIHHLVLEAFVSPMPEGMEAAHLDGRRNNNDVRNLAWVTRKENMAHREK